MRENLPVYLGYLIGVGHVLVLDSMSRSNRPINPLWKMLLVLAVGMAIFMATQLNHTA